MESSLYLRLGLPWKEAPTPMPPSTTVSAWQALGRVAAHFQYLGKPRRSKALGDHDRCRPLKHALLKAVSQCTAGGLHSALHETDKGIKLDHHADDRKTGNVVRCAMPTVYIP